MSPTACWGPGTQGRARCGLPAAAHGLCNNHYRQHKRTGVLKPIRDLSAEPLVNVGIRVSHACRAQVLADIDGAREALERWAKRRSR